MKETLQKNSKFEQLVLEDYRTKLVLKEKEAKYYSDKANEIGLEDISRFIKYHPNPSRLMRLGITYAYRGIGDIAEAMAHNKEWAVISGLNPSGPLHFGHKTIFDELLWLQEQGAEVYIPITNDESYVVDKAKSLGSARQIAYDSVIPSIIAMGFDSKKTHIFVDSDYTDIYNVAMDISKKITLNKAFGVFGFKMDENPGALFYRAAVQIAHILLPQYEEFGGPKPTLVVVGIDQYPYLLLARDVAEKKGFIPPAGLILKFMWGLDGKGKMSSSRKDSSISLTESGPNAQKIVKSSYTGGNPSAVFQKENGGIPEVCPVYHLRAYHFEHDRQLYDDCSSGQLLCGECKDKAADDVTAYLKQHQLKLDIPAELLSQFLLRTPIESVKK